MRIDNKVNINIANEIRITGHSLFREDSCPIEVSIRAMVEIWELKIFI
jgi:hypothetical protein